MKLIKYILAGMFICMFTSCEEDLLGKEQYQKIIYLLSSDNNIFKHAHAMNDSITKGYITVGSGGTIPLEKDITVTLELDTAFLNAYNWRNFDIEYDKYAKWLDSSRYVLPSLEIVLRAGNVGATTFFPVEVDANGLSPDSVYMIPLRIKSSSDYEINESKRSVLYQVEFKNEYSKPGQNSYTMKGTKKPEDGALSAITATKTLLPLAKDRVRFFPENIVGTTTLADIENKTIVVVINDDNTLRLKPYKNIVLEQLTGNHYNPEEEVFNLNYRYKISADDKWTIVTESLKRIK